MKKKIVAVALGLAATTLLASCGGKQITEAEAKQIANTASAKYAKGEVETPKAFTIRTVVDNSYTKSESEVSVDITNKTFHSKSISRSTDGDKVYTETAEVWAYREGEDCIIANASDILKSYAKVSATDASWTSYFGDGKSKGSIEESIESSFASFSSIFASIDTTNTGAVSFQNNSFIHFNKNTQNVSYRSSGEGNLTVDVLIDIDYDAEAGVLGMELAASGALYVKCFAAMDNYLPKEVSLTSSTGKGDKKVITSLEGKFDWGKASFSKPNLKDFVLED